MAKNKIIWAFDPYTDIVETWKRSEEAINVINHDERFEVEPVYVLGADLFKWVGNVTPPQVDHLKPYVEKTLAARLGDISIKGLKAPEIIESMNTSRREDIDSFVEYVKDQKPEMLVLNTHARKGLSRFFMGSFAENVLLRCAVPTLFISPEAAPITKFESLLFPTDFSEHSFSVFKDILEDFKGTVKKVSIFSKVLRPVNAFAEAGVTALGGAWIAPEQYLAQEIQARENDSAAWLSYAKDNGFDVALVIDDSLGDVVDAINNYQESNDIDFVAMSSESGRVESVVIGSIARGIIRSSKKPVFVSHSKE